MSEPVSAQLWTIPISHYCEKARWALDRARVPYVEHAHLPLFHRWPVARAGGGRTTPVLHTPEGTVLSESTDIVRWVDGLGRSEPLFPDRDPGREVETLEARICDQVGPASRRWAYFTLTGDRALAVRHAATGAPAWQRQTFSIFYPLAIRYLLAGLRADAEQVDRDVILLDRWFAEIDARLADGRPYLAGERLTAADVSWACLAAAVVLPVGYSIPLFPPEVLPSQVADRVRAWRERPAGRLVTRLFERERPPTSRVRYGARTPSPPPETPLVALSSVR